MPDVDGLASNSVLYQPEQGSVFTSYEGFIPSAYLFNNTGKIKYRNVLQQKQKRHSKGLTII